MRRSALELEEVVNKVYWRRADAAVVIRALETSGQSLAGFCRQYGLSPQRVGRWRATLSVADEVELVAVDVVDRRRESATRGDDADGSIAIVLRNGRRLMVSPGFDAELLAEVARVVEAWPC